jgi:hypothetical protein
MKEPESVLRHVVLFKIKEGTTPQQIEAIGSAFQNMREKIDAIHDLEWGEDVSIEGKADGFTHCLLVTFKSEADRAAYLPHPDHRAAGATARPHLEKVLVVDFWARA